MRVLESQQLLARLYTDRSARAEYVTDPVGFVNKHRAEHSIAQLNAGQLLFFARSLLDKRAHEVRKLLPITAEVLGGDFFDKFKEYAATCLPAGPKKHAADAMAFCKSLVVGGGDLLTDAVRFEHASLGMRHRLVLQGTNPVICRTRVRRLPWVKLLRLTFELPAIAQGERPRERRTWVLFVAVGAVGGAWYW